MDKTIIVNVRWFDGMYEEFECQEVRFGSHLLFMRLKSGQNRHLPYVSGIRWFSVSPESHEDYSVINCNCREPKPISSIYQSGGIDD